MGVSEVKLWFSKRVSDDLTLISKYTGVKENKWLMRAVLSAVKAEKEDILRLVEQDYVAGLMEDAEFSEWTGRMPDENLKLRRMISSKSSAEG